MMVKPAMHRPSGMTRWRMCSGWARGLVRRRMVCWGLGLMRQGMVCWGLGLVSRRTVCWGPGLVLWALMTGRRVVLRVLGWPGIRRRVRQGRIAACRTMWRCRMPAPVRWRVTGSRVRKKWGRLLSVRTRLSAMPEEWIRAATAPRAVLSGPMPRPCRLTARN